MQANNLRTMNINKTSVCQYKNAANVKICKCESISYYDQVD